ncbi:MAG: Cof-type HAD-IIB family hydrolase [Actinomycetia bacterium]|nr:Cof-type HAD-IIB family hydrolase [Actinomycetes bacterium]
MRPSVIRLVATDLDGTVVRTDGTVSARTVAALAAVEAAGLLLVLVTGRPPRWMADVVAATGHRGVALCGNGAFVYDLHTEQVLEVRPIAPDVGLEVVARLRTALPGAAFAVETGHAFAHDPRYRSRWATPPGTEVAPVEQLLHHRVGKLLVRDEGNAGDAMLATARAVVGDLVEVTHSNPHDCLLEISARGVSKASALARYAAGHGVSAAEVLAFGDQPNDLPMLAWAGTAYVVANAHPDVRAAVPARTGAVDDDGVAAVLERLLDGSVS